MNTNPIDMSPTGGIELDAPAPEQAEALRDAARPADAQGRRATFGNVVARWPDSIAAWAELGDLAFAEGDLVTAYACYRTGYHRSLDALRKSGWRGAGRVPYAHEPNRPFHRATYGLLRVSDEWGDFAEAERCQVLLLDADPSDPLGAKNS